MNLVLKRHCFDTNNDVKINSSKFQKFSRNSLWSRNIVKKNVYRERQYFKGGKDQ